LLSTTLLLLLLLALLHLLLMLMLLLHVLLVQVLLLVRRRRVHHLLSLAEKEHWILLRSRAALIVRGDRDTLHYPLPVLRAAPVHRISRLGSQEEMAVAPTSVVVGGVTRVVAAVVAVYGLESLVELGKDDVIAGVSLA